MSVKVTTVTAIVTVLLLLLSDAAEIHRRSTSSARTTTADAFITRTTTRRSTMLPSSSSSRMQSQQQQQSLFATANNTRLFSSSISSSSSSTTFDQKRQDIFGRTEEEGTFFNLNPLDGKVEFGAVAQLRTQLETNPRASEVLEYWIKDSRRVASCLWQPDMIQTLSEDDNSYRLEVMKLQFVTLTLAPTVDVQMRSVPIMLNGINGSNQRKYQFQLESFGFDPNVQLLPGMSITAEQLGIQIDVVGELAVADSGVDVEGRIGFMSSGILPPPLRLLPQQILQQATKEINQQIVKFAIDNFQTNIRQEYNQFRQSIKEQYELKRQQLLQQ